MSYRHIISKTDNKQVNALHYALALVENEVYNRPREVEGLRNVIKSIESASVLTKDAAEKHSESMSRFGFRSSPSSMIERMNKENQETIRSLNTMISGAESIIEKAQANQQVIMNKLNEIGSPILNCVSEIDITRNDSRQAFVNLNNEFEVAEFETYFTELLTKHFGENKFTLLSRHGLDSDTKTVPLTSISDLYTFAYSKNDANKLQGVLDDFADLAIAKREQAFIERYEAMSNDDKEYFLSIYSNYSSEEVKNASPQERLEICKKVAKSESQEIGYMVGNGSCNMMSDFIESRDINKIINEGYRKPFSVMPHGYLVQDLESFRDIQGGSYFHSSEERRNGELALSSSFFIKENPELQQSADLILSAINDERNNSKSKASELTR